MNDIKPGDWVICIDNNNIFSNSKLEGPTRGNLYAVINCDEYFVKYVGDDNKIHYSARERFIDAVPKMKSIPNNLRLDVTDLLNV